MVAPVPLRYRGFHRTGWHAPHKQEHYLFDVSIRGAQVLPPVGGEQMFRLMLTCSTQDSPPRSMLQDLSARHPAVVVTCRYEELANGYFGGVAYHDGELLGQVSECPATEPGEDDDGSDPNGEYAGEEDPQAAYEERLEAARQAFRVALDLAARKAVPKTITATRRARWSTLASAAAVRGVSGFLEELRQVGGPGQQARALGQDLKAAARRGGLSWLDACMTWPGGMTEELDYVLLQHEEGAPGLTTAEIEDRNYNADARALSRPRMLSLLRACAPQPVEQTQALVLVELLSNPETRLMSGAHPIAFLCDAAKDCHGVQAQAGLARLIARMSRRLPVMAEAPLLGMGFLRSDAGSHAEDLADFFASTIAGHEVEDDLKHALLSNPLLESASRDARGPRLNPQYRFDPRADALLRSVLHAGIMGGKLGYELARAAGIQEDFLFACVAALAPREALQTVSSFNKDLRFLSEPATHSFRLACDQFGLNDVAAGFDALCREARMRELVANATDDASAPAPARQRRAGL